MDSNRVKKPVVVWLCDTKGWAYDNIATKLLTRLPSFEHVKVYINSINDYEIVRKTVEGADIVVSMFLHYLVPLKKLNNVVIRLDGFRAFEHVHNAVG